MKEFIYGMLGFFLVLVGIVLFVIHITKDSRLQTPVVIPQEMVTKDLPPNRKFVTANMDHGSLFIVHRPATKSDTATTYIVQGATTNYYTSYQIIEHFDTTTLEK